MKKLSIITVTLNCEKYIEKTILNVLNFKRNFKLIEFIIIDGKSTDKTLEIIHNYKNQIDILVSEKDCGIFDAMNKGIQLATSDWVMFLNAGDLLSEEFIDIQTDVHEHIALIYGNTLDIGIGKRMPFNLNYLEYGMIFACHQSMLFNKKLLNKELYYDLNYSSYNDYELVVRITKKKFNILYVNKTIAHYLGNGISTLISTKKRVNKVKMMYDHFGFLGIFKMTLFRLGYKPKMTYFE